MADSVREAIIKNRKTALEGITTGNGFANTLLSVQRLLQGGQTTKDTPCAVLLEADDEVIAEGPLSGAGSLVTRDLTLGVLLFVRQDEASDSRSASEVMNSLVGDVQKKMQEDYQCGGKAIDVNEAGISAVDIEEGEPVLACTVAYRIRYRHRRTDPTQVT